MISKPYLPISKYVIDDLDFLWHKKTSGPTYVGKWKYEIPDMTSEDNTGVLVINTVEDVYIYMSITNNGYEQPIDNFDIQDKKIIVSNDSQGILVKLSETIGRNSITGNISAQKMTLADLP